MENATGFVVTREIVQHRILFHIEADTGQRGRKFIAYHDAEQHANTCQTVTDGALVESRLERGRNAIAAWISH